jgi:hypothetical protein
MLTDVRSRIDTTLVWVIVLRIGLLFAIVVLRPVLVERGPGQAVMATEDVHRLKDVRLEPVTVPVLVDRDRAIGIAKGLYDWDKVGGTVDTFLKSVTDPAVNRGPDPVENRPVWMIHISNVALPQGGPWNPETGEAEPGRVLRHAYGFIDANSGEHLYTRWTE